MAKVLVWSSRYISISTQTSPNDKKKNRVRIDEWKYLPKFCNSKRMKKEIREKKVIEDSHVLGGGMIKILREMKMLNYDNVK